MEVLKVENEQQHKTIFKKIEMLENETKLLSDKVNDNQKEITRLKEELLHLPKLIDEKNNSQTLELQVAIRDALSDQNKAMIKWVATIFGGVLTAVIIAYLNIK